MWYSNKYVVSGIHGNNPIMVGPFNSLAKALLFLARFGRSVSGWQLYKGGLDRVGVMTNITAEADRLIQRLQKHLQLDGSERDVRTRDISHDPLLPKVKTYLSNLRGIEIVKNEPKR